MDLTLFIVENCPTCKRVVKNVKSLAESNPSVNLHISNINEVKKNNIVIVPALFVDDQLYAYGDFDMDKLNKQIDRNDKF